MILDTLENASLYSGINSKIKAALEFLSKNDFSQFAIGEYEIKGDEIFAKIKENKTKPLNEGVWEAHKKFLDVQFMLEGSEVFGFANINRMNAATQYDAERDYWSFTGDGDLFTLKEGSFAIFFPQDVHMTSILVDQPRTVKKIVIKVHLDETIQFSF